ncbi:hypothetical protein P7K49_006218 [Saguinus oedipus]|uniref:Uncharacterized protein n=1 Tax=Saguinus oedipus TaxID=9490 RepID=A0ABQ9W1S8_SAGOE|nr:hypothetical protein P7K49_006218 [Saguinus oedipus]
MFETSIVRDLYVVRMVGLKKEQAINRAGIVQEDVQPPASCDMNTCNQWAREGLGLFCHLPDERFQSKTAMLSCLMELFENVQVDKAL